MESDTNGKITITLLSERQDGEIGDDWQYTLRALVFNDGLIDEGRIEVPEHTLPTGVEQAPPGPPEPLVLNAGPAGSEVLVRLRVDATEVDALVDDHGTLSRDVSLRCPETGAPPVNQESTLAVGVLESPIIDGDSSMLRLTLRLSAES